MHIRHSVYTVTYNGLIQKWFLVIKDDALVLFLILCSDDLSCIFFIFIKAITMSSSHSFFKKKTFHFNCGICCHYPHQTPIQTQKNYHFGFCNLILFFSLNEGFGVFWVFFKPLASAIRFFPWSLMERQQPAVIISLVACASKGT